MKSIIIKYSVLVWCLSIIAANFIACGTQMYQVSIQEDLDTQAVSQSNPEVNDPTSTLYGIHSVDGWKELPIRFYYGAKLNQEQQMHLKAAMNIWEIATGKTLFSSNGVHTGVTGDHFKDLYSSLDDNINGDYLDDDWAKTKKPDQVLATTIWNTAPRQSAIATADIRFNSQGYIIGDSLINEATEEREVVDMQSLAIHELGHLLGLAHVDSDVDPYSIMNPTLFIGEGRISRDLSTSDIERIQTIYGCQGDACDMAKVQKKLRDFQQQFYPQEQEAH